LDSDSFEWDHITGYFEKYNESSKNAFTRPVTQTFEERFFGTEMFLTLQI
jgi:hypothetical protein